MEVAAEAGALDDLGDDEGVEHDDGDVGDDLHDEDLGPEGVEVLVERVRAQRRRADRGVVGVREHVRFQLEELERKKSIAEGSCCGCYFQ